MDIIELLDAGYDWTARRIAEIATPVTAADLAARTPCERWSLHQLLNHQIGVVGMMADRITSTDGEPASSALQLADTDCVGTDPSAAYAAAVERASAAFHTPGVLDGTCVLALGEVSVRMAATLSLTDVVVHGWDVARALGKPVDIPPTLAESILELASPFADSVRGRAFGPEITDLPPDASASDRLVAFLGRKP